MNTKPLETFAKNARRKLHEEIGAKLHRVLQPSSLERRLYPAKVRDLEAHLTAATPPALIERVAYTWFNRFCALRYMDANHYTPVGVVSPAEGYTQPEILQEAHQGQFHSRWQQTVNPQQVQTLLGRHTPAEEQEAYRSLLVAACNALHSDMPYLFEPINDYTELLMPDDLLSERSILHDLRQALTREACQEIEIIGWLYQFYIAEKKDAVMASTDKVAASDIPAATQLFTPNWIVRYLVENSLGRLWLRHFPHSPLREQMAYYIPPVADEPPPTAPLTSPEQISLCDPAVGSAHMLVYAFDLLAAMYEEQGYPTADIPRLILTHNLVGLEIDERAAALAAFALSMKARAYDSRFFRRATPAPAPRITTLYPVRWGADELRAATSPWLADLPADWHEALHHDLTLFAEADNVGALLRPRLSVAQLETALHALAQVQAQTIQPSLLGGQTQVWHKAAQALRQALPLARKYAVVVANPPYMGGRNMNEVVKRFAERQYPDSKSDLFAMFMAQGGWLAAPMGYMGMINMQSWMFLSSYETLREWLLAHQTIVTMAHLGARAFDTIGGEVVSTTAFVVANQHQPDYQGTFVRLVEGNSEAEKEAALWAAIANPDCGWFYRATAVDFRKIPGSPIAYWVSSQIRKAFTDTISIDEIFFSDGLTKTGNNELFLRFHWEVSRSKGEDQNQYRICVKGGESRNYYGNLNVLIKWNDQARKHYKNDNVARITPEYLWQSSGISWTKISSKGPTFRWFGNGMIAETGGPAIFLKKELEESILWQGLGFLASKVSWEILTSINPTLNFQTNDVLSLPINLEETKATVDKTKEALKLTSIDWDSYETSWDFETLPLLRPAYRQPTLAATYTTLRTHWQQTTLAMQQLQEANNRLFIEAYGLQAELTPAVPLREITLTCNPAYRYNSAKLDEKKYTALQARWPTLVAPWGTDPTQQGLELRLLEDTLKEFLSYAVGCMFGRYALHTPGLILANQGEGLTEYAQRTGTPLDNAPFPPTSHNVIPILPSEGWFADDITSQAKRFLRLTFGEAHYEENLALLETVLGKELNSYFQRDFYSDHVQRYSKRPIYFLFTSPKGGFNALIYLHRYQPATVGVVLNQYLREYRAKLETHQGYLAKVADNASLPPRERATAERELTTLAKTIAELIGYENDLLYPLATRPPELDLDDGVLANHAKFGAAVRKL